jgi:signal transduction histidine kinase
MNGNPLRPLLADTAWRDLACALALALLAALLAAQVDLHELMFESTRRWEALQLDEWPAALLVFAFCLLVLYARRYVQLQRVLAMNRRLIGQTMQVQEQERHRLARELHDELGQYLNAIKLDAQTLQLDSHASDNTNAPAKRIAAAADHVYEVAGNLVRRLRPPALDELGLSAALEACVNSWQRTNPSLGVQLSIGGSVEGLGEKVNLAIYRIVQEALTNCVRHAHATHMYIDLTRAPGTQGGSLLLELRDDGAGMRKEQAPGAGHGLAGMRERATQAGGSFELLSEPGRGVTIRVEIPVAETDL